MKKLLHHVSSRPRMLVALVAGLAAAGLVPGDLHPVTRSLIGWNVGVWLFLALVALMMFQADHHRLRRTAVAHAEGAAAVLVVVVGAVGASMVAIVVELAHTGQSGGAPQMGSLLFAGITVLGSWLVLPMEFALQYASLYYSKPPDGGLAFPHAEPDYQPDYLDFLYFSFTIAVACQTSDVSVTERPMRRTVLLHSLLAFVFNTAILALSVNVAASLVRP